MKGGQAQEVREGKGKTAGRGWEGRDGKICLVLIFLLRHALVNPLTPKHTLMRCLHKVTATQVKHTWAGVTLLRERIHVHFGIKGLTASYHVGMLVDMCWQTDRQTDRQTYRHTHIHTYIHTYSRSLLHYCSTIRLHDYTTHSTLMDVIRKRSITIVL